jgi:hypothetical protein
MLEKSYLILKINIRFQQSLLFFINTLWHSWDVCRNKYMVRVDIGFVLRLANLTKRFGAFASNAQIEVS